MTPFDFGQHVGHRSTTDLTDPIALFHALDRKTSHTTLRPPQESALKEANARRTQRDLVLKMPTGTGKSTVGLLYLRAKGAELRRPVVYLCPTVQLVGQVLEESERLGVKSYHYASGSPHPESSCMAGDAIIVCTYDKLFNALTTFDRTDVDITPAAIVLDDAHAGIEEIRDAFSLRITSKETVGGLLKILDGPARAYSPSYWDDLRSGRPGVNSVEIPYWSWRGVVGAVSDAISGDTTLKFAYPFLRDILRWCRCIVDATGIEIVPPVPPVRAVRAYRESSHRMFMSATLADDSVLVRELGCDPAAALKPIAPAPGSFGERLVLVPSLIDASLDLDWVRRYCAVVSKKWNVAVLCSSERDAIRWRDHGATVVKGDQVADAVRQLRDGRLKFVAFANRYDGVDLPDDACRILVLDGMPSGQGIAAAHDGAIRGSFQHRVAYRIEQGMGRAVRSNADYAVVILAGPNLASFTAKPEVRQQMSADARAQIELAHTLPSLVRSSAAPARPEDVCDQMIHQCLTRSQGWRAFYEDRVRRSVGASKSSVDPSRVTIAEHERKAAERAYSDAACDAVVLIQQVLDSHLSRSAVKGNRNLERTRAFYVQAMAAYLHDSDPGKSLQLQGQAHEIDPILLRPATGAVKRRLSQDAAEQAALALRHYATFENPNAYIADFESIRADLSFDSDARRFERALCEVSAFLGVEASRPEHEEGEGPDVLMAWATTVLVVEAKNEREGDTIPKKDAEQLLHSMRWFDVNYGKVRPAVPILVARAVTADSGVHMPDGARIVTPDHLASLLAAASGFVRALAQRTLPEWESSGIHALLEGHRLTPERFVASFSLASK